MEGIEQVIGYVSQIGISAFFVGAWIAERRERQEMMKMFATQMEKLASQYLSLLREMSVSQSRPILPPTIP